MQYWDIWTATSVTCYRSIDVYGLSIPPLPDRPIPIASAGIHSSLERRSASFLRNSPCNRFARLGLSWRAFTCWAVFCVAIGICRRPAAEAKTSKDGAAEERLGAAAVEFVTKRS